jgi:hypothetical protein
MQYWNDGEQVDLFLEGEHQIRLIKDYISCHGLDTRIIMDTDSIVDIANDLVAKIKLSYNINVEQKYVLYVLRNIYADVDSLYMHK